MSVAGDSERPPPSSEAAVSGARSAQPQSAESGAAESGAAKAGSVLVEAGRLGATVLLAAVLLAVLDVAAICSFVSAALSSATELLALFAWTILIFTTVAAPFALAWRLGKWTLAARLPSADAAIATSVALTALAISAARAVINAGLAKSDVEFPERLALALGVLELGVVVGLLGIGRWVVWPLVKWVFARAPRLSNPRGVVAFWLLLATGLLGAGAAWGLAPIHLLQPATLYGVAGLGLAVVFWDLVLPVPSRRGALAWLLLLGVLVVAGASGQRSRSARYFLFAHSPMARGVAESLRDAVDRDGDGASSTWLLGQDCAEGDASRGPAHIELRGDGIDQDCRGGDAPPWPEPRAARGVWAVCQIPPRPSVLLVTVDAMRSDALGPELTPALWRLGQQGQYFARAYSPTGLTRLTFASLFTGYPASSLAENLLETDEVRLPTTLTERLRRQGYRTAVINYLKMDPATLGGFESINRQQQIDLHPGGVKHHLASAAVTNGAIEYVNRETERPYFLALHYPDLHAPYLEPPDQRFSAGELTAYDRSLAYTDHHIGRLLAALSRSGALGRTIVVVTADHGESLGQRGHEGHGVNVFDETVHVPLLIWVPGCPPRRFDEPVSLTNLGGSLSVMLGMPARETLLATPAQAGQRATVSEATMTTTRVFLRSVVLGDYKLVVDVRSGGRLLFDLAADPGETVNLYAARPEVVQQLEAAYQRWLDRRPPVVD